MAQRSCGAFTVRMTRTRLQIEADRIAAVARHRLANDLRQFRQDAGVTQRVVAERAGIDASLVSRLEAERVDVSLETYFRVAHALGSDIHVRAYPNTGPRIADRHQVRMFEILRTSLGRRWIPEPEVTVQRPARGWIDVALRDVEAGLVVATELESTINSIERVIRWSTAKAESLPSSSRWPAWCAGTDREPSISRLLVVRWTRHNRDALAAARRELRDAYPAEPHDAIEALAGEAHWPGPALLFLREEGPRPRLLDGRP